MKRIYEVAYLLGGCDRRCITVMAEDVEAAIVKVRVITKGDATEIVSVELRMENVYS
jgi:hypothetical protein